MIILSFSDPSFKNPFADAPSTLFSSSLSSLSIWSSFNFSYASSPLSSSSLICFLLQSMDSPYSSGITLSLAFSFSFAFSFWSVSILLHHLSRAAKNILLLSHHNDSKTLRLIMNEDGSSSATFHKTLRKV